jgi:hypothetical protein
MSGPEQKEATFRRHSKEYPMQMRINVVVASRQVVFSQLFSRRTAMCRKSTCLVLAVLTLSWVLTGMVRAELVGWWKFDEGSGTVAHDSSGKGNDGTASGNPAWVTGHFGAALGFDGSNDYLDCGNNPSLNLTTWTVAFWLNVNQNKNYNGFVIKGLDAAENYEVLGFADGSFHFPITFTDGSRTFLNSPAGAIVPGEWAHFAYSYDSKEGRKLYKNGVSIFAAAESKTPQASTASLTIGNEQPMSRYVDGVMDDVRIYNHALTEGEILGAMGGLTEAWPYAFSPSPADGAYNKDTWVSLSWKPGARAVSHDAYLGENFADVNSGAPSTFRGNQAAASLIVGLGLPGDPYPGGLVPGTTYYWRIDEVNTAHPNSPWKGPVWRFSIPPRTAYDPIPADGAESVALNSKLAWTAGFGAKLHTVYVGTDFDTVSNATTGGAMSGTASYSPPSLKAGQVYYWRVDETNPPNTYKGQVWSFTTPGAVGKPHPANGNADAEMNAILSWTRSAAAASHQVYFGTDKEAVRKATVTSPEYKGVKALGSESYDPGLLPWDSTYYWRIDEVNNTNPASPWKGPLWTFTTGKYLLVEDFESYNDIDPPAAGSSRIFDKWIDGFGTTTNGAVVGNNLPPYAERTIIHGGAQSMPLAYDNNLKFSEATKTLVSGRDWTAQGVTSLSLWFRGASTNAAEKMYVALNGTAVVYHDNANAAKMAGWTQWVIPLQQFADQGVNLTSVTSITIGLGTKGNTTAAGGAGKMYIDDIQLYR